MSDDSVKQSSLEKMIFKELKTGPLSGSQLAITLGIDFDVIRSALERMQENGQVERRPAPEGEPVFGLPKLRFKRQGSDPTDNRGR